jgi:hypothetical protein
MNYVVTHGLSPTAIEQGFYLEGALTHAHQLLSDGKRNVAIQDGNAFMNGPSRLPTRNALHAHWRWPVRVQFLDGNICEACHR